MASVTLVGALVTAGVLGFTHAIEPDHVAGISSLAGEANDSRLSAIVGACFSLGHVALVVVWLGVLSVLGSRRTLPDSLDAIGPPAAALLLGVLGTVMAAGGLRAVFRTDERSRRGVTRQRRHVHVPFPGPRDAGDHDHGVVGYLQTGVVGALFTLSPPVSMIAFAGTLFPQYGLGAVSLTIAVYAITITLAMSAIGAGVGTVLSSTRRLDERAYGTVRIVTGVAVVTLAVVLFVSAVPSV